jgi:hypothetical protein
MTSHLRRIAVPGFLIATAIAVAACSGAPAPTPTQTNGSSVDSETAKQQMIDAVDDVTGRLGGAWDPQTGPDYPEDCVLPDGSQGAHWAYLVRRESGGDPVADSTMLVAHWEAQGKSIDRWGSEDRPVVVGRGGDVSSVSLQVAGARYSVQAVSLCFPGDADEIAERIADEAAVG